MAERGSEMRVASAVILGFTTTVTTPVAVGADWDAGRFIQVGSAPTAALMVSGGRFLSLSSSLRPAVLGEGEFASREVVLSVLQSAHEVRLQVTVPVGSVATVDVFNVAGRRVATLHEGLLPGGSAVLRWDGRTKSGAAAASGVYFVRLRNEARQAIEKVIWIR